MAVAPSLSAEETESSPIQERFTEAVELVDQERFAEALEIFREVEHVRPHPVVRYNIAWCLSQLGRYQEAIESFEGYLIDGGDDSAERAQYAREELRRLRELAAGASESTASTESEEPATETAVEEVSAQDTDAAPTEPVERSRRRLRPPLFWGFLGLTLATGAVAIGTGAAALSLSQTWQDQWDEDDRDRGEALAVTTNVLLGLLAAEAVATLVIGIFTDFRGRASHAASRTPGFVF